MMLVVFSTHMSHICIVPSLHSCKKSTIETVFGTAELVGLLFGGLIFCSTSTFGQPLCIQVHPDTNGDAVDRYEQGSKLRDPTRKEMVGYFTRLASYYTNGGFFDECGSFVRSPYRYRFAWWEVFNEPDAEHHQSIQVSSYRAVWNSSSGDDL